MSIMTGNNDIEKLQQEIRQDSIRRLRAHLLRSFKQEIKTAPLPKIIHATKEKPCFTK